MGCLIPAGKLYIILKIGRFKLFQSNHLPYSPSADPEGGDRGSGPPLRFVRGGVLCRGLMGRRGGPTVVFTLSLSIFFLARFARQYYTNVLQIYILSSSIFSIERSSFLYITLILMKRIKLTFPCFHKRASSYFSCLKLHDFTPFYTKNSWGRTP